MNQSFFDTLGQFGEQTALISETGNITYAELEKAAKQVTAAVPARSLVFCMCRNCAEAVIGYVGFLQKRAVPVMLNAGMEKELWQNLLSIYQPGYIWCPADFMAGDPVMCMGNYKLLATGNGLTAMHEDLALLLTTSGSTGSPKFVRQTYRNIEANAKSIVEYLHIRPKDRAITTLPLNYTYGLSILQTHLMAGAQVIMTDCTFFDKAFWNLFREKEASTFGAVPYNYQMLDRLRFLRMDLPSLRYITQAGGRLGETLHRKFAQGLRDQGRELIVMYGATEATARMSYVPAEFAVEKADSIGVAIPGGRFELIDTDGSVIDGPERVGELVYYGDNVTMGYAECRADLAKGDERGGMLETGDMAKRDGDGYYYVVGRKQRFLKIYGNRVNLVEVEKLLAQAGYEAACTGEDDHLRIYTTGTGADVVAAYLSEKTGINRAAFEVIHIDVIPRNDAGKVLYSELK